MLVFNSHIICISTLEMAEVALSRCVSKHYDSDRRIDQITYSFEFIDDFDVPYSTITGCMKHIGLIKSTPTMPPHEIEFSPLRRGKSSGFKKIDSNTLNRIQNEDDHDEEWLQSDYDGNNHVLHLMVSSYIQYRSNELFT